MSELYPLRLKPEFSPRPWGTRDLRPIYVEFPGATSELIGEAWLTGDQCKIANGPLAGQSLAEVTKRYGRELVGKAAPQADHIPMMKARADSVNRAGRTNAGMCSPPNPARKSG
jgi:mannose-6-phosphate isomerase class I